MLAILKQLDSIPADQLPVYLAGAILVAIVGGVLFLK